MHADEALLLPSLPVRRDPVRAQPDIYRLQLGRGTCAIVEITQRNADVRVEVEGPDRRPLTAFDTPDQDTGLERLRIVAQRAGVHTVRVTPRRPAGAYDIVLAEVRRATLADVRVMQAQCDFMTAEALRLRGTESANRTAIAVYERAIAGFAQGGEPRGEGVACNSLALLRALGGDRDGARRNLEQSLALRRSTGDRSGEAQTLCNLGVALEHDGRLREALELYGRALVLRQETGDCWGIANSFTRLGLLYASLDEVHKADALLARAASMWREIGDDAWELITLIERARLQTALGRSEEADSLYARARALHPKGRGRVALATALTDAGWRALADRAPQRARARFAQALDIGRASGALDVQTHALEGLAFAWMREAEGREAAARTRALGFARDAGVRACLLAHLLGRAQEADAQAVLMRILAARGDRQAAIDVGFLAIDAWRETGRDLDGPRSTLRQRYLEARGDTFRRLASLLVVEGRLLEAEQVLAVLKIDEYARFLRSGATQTPALSAARAPEVKQCAALIDRAASLARACEDLRVRGLRSSSDKQRYLALRDELAAASEAVIVFFDSVRATAPRDAAAAITDLEKTTSAEMSDLGAIGSDVVALHTLVLEDELTIIMVTPQTRIARRYAPPNGGRFRRTALRALVASLREALQDPRIDPRPRARALYDIVVGPVAEDLRRYQARTIMWFVDGDLRYVPMAALHDGTRWLVESYRMETATLSSLPRLKDAPRTAWRGLGLGVSRPHEVSREGGEIDLFPALPSVRDELAVIRDGAQPKSDGLFDGRVLIDEGFTAQALREALLPDADGGFPLVHVASHFQLVPGDISRSYLLLGDGTPLPLTWFNRRGEQLFRDVDLLTLSACNTATGAVTAEGIEMDGFAELAQQQGARAVLATLWPVADISTAVLMKDLYRRRAADPSLPKVEALRQAQLSLLEGRIRPPADATTRAEAHYIEPAPADGRIACPPWPREAARPFAHPFFWAPFVLFGNWR